MSTVNSRIDQFGLHIDEFEIKDHGEYVSFLDTKFCFDDDGNLQTDLYVKETDARSYLYYGSSHPNHTYTSIVYSQCLRLRRIINCDQRLCERIDELKNYFFNSNYPKKIVDKIANKVKGMERILRKTANTSNSSMLVPESPARNPAIRVISTYGSDGDLVSVVRRAEATLQRTRSFSQSSGKGSTVPSQSSQSSKTLFQFVKKTGSSLRQKLVNVKGLATRSDIAHTHPCGHRNCQTCSLIPTDHRFTINGIKLESAPGDCSTYNIVYLFMCRHCQKVYVGRTVQKLHFRVNGHRASYYKLLKSPHLVDNCDDDTYSLGAHLIFDHGFPID